MEYTDGFRKKDSVINLGMFDFEDDYVSNGNARRRNERRRPRKRRLRGDTKRRVRVEDAGEVEWKSSTRGGRPKKKERKNSRDRRRRRDYGEFVDRTDPCVGTREEARTTGNDGRRCFPTSAERACS